ncbi:hypothetical protein RNZ50_18910 [Paracoccaceae bacterium Fryx2]|nr:hypothetical protein [Paracoccaceae bacterium Fryx2]
MRQILIALLATLAPLGAMAAPTECQTSVSGIKVQHWYDPTESVIKQNRSTRERIFGGYGDITCPGYVTLREMTRELTDDQRGVFCLNYDKDRKTYLGFAQGPRDAWLTCTEPSKSFCERVNNSKDAALEITGLGGGNAVGKVATAGVNVVTGNSGAVILSGSGGYVASTLSSLGTTAFSVLTAPATLTAAAVTVVAVGGAVYVCSE